MSLQEENEDHLLLLKESDFTEFFDQFPFNEVFQYILHITNDGIVFVHACVQYVYVHNELAKYKVWL